MPRTAKNLWDQIIAWDNLLLAAKEASRYKRWHFEVMRFNADLEENLFTIQEQLAEGSWRPGVYREFEVYEPKRRAVHAPPFADRVVHHALVQIIGPYFERRFIDQSFACRKNKGTHAASRYLTFMLRSASDIYPQPFCLKADISKYFLAINHDILLAIISRVIGDERTLALVWNLVSRCANFPNGRGLPLGSLTSQLFANIYLDQLDHFVKSKLRVRFYARYMDDFIILAGDKPWLWGLLAQICEFVEERLALTLNPKTGIFPISRGVDFVGYRHWPDHILPRKRNTKRARRQFRELARLYANGKIDFEYARPRVASFLGYMRHCDCYKTLEAILDEFVLRRC